MKICIALLVVIVPNLLSIKAVNPVQKVVELLTDLEAKVIKDGEVEQKAYEEYVEWCSTGAKDKEWEIKTAKADIAELEATIEKAIADRENFESKIEELAAAVTANEEDLKAATEIRNKEEADFKASESELVEALDTIDRAISILEKKMRGSALVQKQINMKDINQVVKVLETVIAAASFDSADKKRLVALAQSDSNEDSDEDDEDLGAPAPDAFKSQSGSIVDVLEEMKEKAESQLNEVRKSEMNARHNYDMLKQSLTDQLQADNAELSESKTGKADSEEIRASAEGDLAVTKKDLTDAEKVLGNMHVDCMTKAQDHEASVKARAEEIKTLQAARKIISETTGGAAEKQYSFLQLDGHQNGLHSQLQTRADLANFEVVNLLRKLAKEQKSTELNQLAARVGSVIRYGTANGEDPFIKVREMIEAMITRLEKEAAEEADHKAYCDAEMAKTAKHRKELEYDVETVSAKIDKAKTKSAKLKEEVAELNKEIAEITKLQGQQEKIRQDQHAAFVETKADLEQGLNGIRAAMKILKDYYAQEGEASFLESGIGLLQKRTKQPAAPVTHTPSSAGSGVIGMLEVIESDFAKNLAQITTEEDGAEVAFQKVHLELMVSKGLKDRDVKYKAKESAALDKSVSELSSDLEGAQSELDSLLSYTANLRGMCELKPETYADRKGRREAEIKGLREALAILDGEAVLLQRLKKPFLKRHGAL